MKSTTDPRLVEPVTKFKKDNYEEIKVTAHETTVELAMTENDEMKGEIRILTDPDVEIMDNMPSAIQYQNQTLVNISTQKFIGQLGLPADVVPFNILAN